MKKKLIVITLIFIILIIAAGLIISYLQTRMNINDNVSEYIVNLNEIEQLTKAATSSNPDEYKVIQDKINYLQDNIRSVDYDTDKTDIYSHIYIICGICITFVLLVFCYAYFAILNPFYKMKNYAHRIAGGEFDIPLNYERSNYFGEFTWAFDHMRKEITIARSCEKEAIENNKTVIATLSHDIKTPISSIRAYAEGLEANINGTTEKRSQYLSVIIHKCDEVANLTNDLFLHSISDLNKLKINLENVEICSLLKDTIKDICTEQDDIIFSTPEYTAHVLIDKNRFVQITENLINNSRKYAKTNINISTQLIDNNIHIHFRDFGPGIPDEDMPFIFNKFYRGRNCGDEHGSGLGLYIVDYVVKQMKGEVSLHNYPDGFEAIIIFPTCSL